MSGIHVDAVIDLFVNLASLDELESRMGVLPSKAASASTSVSEQFRWNRKVSHGSW
jgi:hypothetical protein